MSEIRNTHCCAVADLAFIEDEAPEDVVNSVWKYAYPNYLDEPSEPDGQRFYVFTEAFYPRGTHYGEALARYIKKHKLGLVTKSAKGNNPDHDSTITVYIWRLSDSGMFRYGRKHGFIRQVEDNSLFA